MGLCKNQNSRRHGVRTSEKPAEKVLEDLQRYPGHLRPEPVRSGLALVQQVPGRTALREGRPEALPLGTLRVESMATNYTKQACA